MRKRVEQVAPGSRRKGETPGELALLAYIRGRADQSRAAELRLGIGDDCALLNCRPGEELAVTTDLSIAGRHFRLDWHPPESIGHRTLARGLSDLAAMGARPVAAFLSLGLSRELTLSAGRRPAWVHRFFDGFLALAEAFKTPLAGGDLAESPVAVADIVLIGAVPRGSALLRSGAQPGDLLYVTGALGGASAALARLGQLTAAAKDPTKAALYPQENAGGTCPPSVPSAPDLSRPDLTPPAPRDRRIGPERRPLHRLGPPVPGVQRGRRSRCSRASHPPRGHPCPGASWRRGLRTALHCVAGRPRTPHNRRCPGDANRSNRPRPTLPSPGRPHHVAAIPIPRTSRVGALLRAFEALLSYTFKFCNRL